MADETPPTPKTPPTPEHPANADQAGGISSGAPATANPTDPDPTQAGGTNMGSKFIPKSNADLLKDGFGLKTLDPHLQEMLKDAKIQKSADGKGLMVDLGNGNPIYAGKGQDGKDFIAPSDPSKPIDEKSANVMISMAKAKGWDKINVNGNTPAERDMLWIEAQRQGLQVQNYKPKPDSDIVKQWKDEQVNGRNHGVSQAPETDPHLATLKLLKDKMDHTDDKDVKAALGQVLDKFKNGNAHVDNPQTLQALTVALSDQNSPKAGFNLAADILNKADPSLAIAKLDAPAAAAPGTKTPPARPTRNASAPA